MPCCDVTEHGQHAGHHSMLGNHGHCPANRARQLYKNMCWVYGTYEACREPTHVNPTTGELALNGSTDKAGFTACIACILISMQATQRAMPSQRIHAATNIRCATHGRQQVTSVRANDD